MKITGSSFKQILISSLALTIVAITIILLMILVWCHRQRRVSRRMRDTFGAPSGSWLGRGMYPGQAGLADPYYPYSPRLAAPRPPPLMMPPPPMPLQAPPRCSGRGCPSQDQGARFEEIREEDM